MIFESLNLLTEEMKNFLMFKGNMGGGADLVALSRIVDDQGKLSIDQDTIAATLVNVEEERVNRQFAPRAVVNHDNSVDYMNPKIDVNLYVIFVANFKTYTQSLKAIANVMAFFQKNSVFTQENFPSMDPGIEKFVVELQTMSFEQLSYLWGTLGFSYLPSALYKIRLVSIEETNITKKGAAVDEFNLQAGGFYK